MKDKTISIRVTEEEYQRLNMISSQNKMNVSHYIRSLIQDSKPIISHNQEAAKAIAKIYVKLEELGIEDEELTEEVHMLCQNL